METPKPESKLTAAAEYALIVGAGAGAAMSLAAQQVAAASVPVTALVAIGLMNRRRLDRQVQASAPAGSSLTAPTPQTADETTPQVTTHPASSPVVAPTSGPTLSTQPQLSPVARPAPSPVARIPFAPKQQRLMAAQQALRLAQADSLKAIGAQLQQARLDRGLALKDIQQQTYIQRYALQAIESGDLDALPEPFYVQAFIKKYAIAVGLSDTAIADQFPTA